MGPRADERDVAAEKQHSPHSQPNFFNLSLATTKLGKDPSEGSEKGGIKEDNGQHALLRRTFSRIGSSSRNTNNSFDDNPKRRSEYGKCLRKRKTIVSLT